ncbi:MAG TPA: hypothetical protein VLE48_02125 [Terriglobales bacterium]|nr:hypothetical protein [Terriglobales bacterium]
MNAKRISMLVLAAGLAWAQQSAPPQGARAAEPTAAAPAVKAPAGAPKGSAGRRDPFVSIVAPGPSGGAIPACPSGKRCLVADQVELKGVAKTPDGMIAMVVTRENKTYFLRENEPVLNGYVLKITGDSIIFRENMMDSKGRTATRDIVKRVVTSAV